MPISKLRPSFTFTEDRLKALQAVVPEAFADGKINWEALREALGERLEDETQEHFGLSWPGKREARRLAATPSKGTLLLRKDESVDVDTTRNIYIEGDNLEVLKLLQKSYAGRVSVIYIDPPYNTGKDRLYKDNYQDSTEEYLKKQGLVSDAGELLTTNPKSDGRYHSNWLNFIYPRLLLARYFLNPDGLIFISIDDNEVHNLRCVMDEIMGEENFIAQIAWKNVYGGGAKSKYVVSQHEYVLCYTKSSEALGILELPPEPEARKRYTERDEKYSTRGPYFTQPLATTSMDFRPNLRFPIFWNGEEIWPEKQWQWSKEKVGKALANNELVIRKDSGKWSVRYKQYLRDDDGVERGAKLYSFLTGPWSQEGTAEIEELFGDGKVFAFPKPTKLIKQFISSKWKEQSPIIMDFFAGSCPTAQAVYEINNELGLDFQYILVQIPEVVENSKFRTVAEIGKARIRNVISRQKEGASSSNQMFASNETKADLGFRVFQFVASNFREWDNYRGDKVGEVQDLFDLHQSPLRENRVSESLITEIILINGFPLDSVVQIHPSFTENQVYRINSQFCEFDLYVCVDAILSPTTIEKITNYPNDIFICLDSALSDEAKLRLSDRCNLKVI